MRADERLKSILAKVRNRQGRLQFCGGLAFGWGSLMVLGLIVLFIERESGWGTWLASPAFIVAGILFAAFMVIRQKRIPPNWRQLVQQIETRFPQLDGRLLTAVQQSPGPDQELNYLQHRVVEEALRRNSQDNWEEIVPTSRIRLAQAAHWLTLVLLLMVVFNLPKTESHQLVSRVTDFSLTVVPGDTTVERGNSVVIFARFGKVLPPGVDLILEQAAGQKRMPLTKSLADPVFGASIPEVSTNLLYHLEYAGQKTRSFQITVFDYPKLERADANLTFPEYTLLPPKKIENTRRVSAVEGSRVDLKLQFNKPVRSAQLISKEKDVANIVLKVETNQPAASLKDFPLVTSKTYELQLIDADGRTNKANADFIFAALKNQTPDLKLSSPRGDIRPSALEEITFEGTVWDDFGVESFGFAYGLPGEQPHFVELGGKVSAREKSSFKHVFRLEELGIAADQVVAWFTWADDKGPDGKVRRTAGDMYFAEVRPFDEIFREGMSAGGGGGGGGGGQSGGTRLLELQKKIISATWNLQRQYGTPMRADQMKIPGDRKLEPAKARQSKAQPRPGPTAIQLTLLSLDPTEFALSDTFKQRVGGRRQYPDLSRHFTFFGQVGGQTERAPQSTNRRRTRGSESAAKGRSYPEDARVVYESMAHALEEAQAAAEDQRDPRGEALWNAAVTEMKKTLQLLAAATNSPNSLSEVVLSEQSAYQALLKLQEHEYEVMRNNKNQSQGGGGGQQMQRQLEQMEMTQSEDRYETQRQAQRPQNSQAREQLQVLNRLQELARRQQDLNDRLKELQTALQEAKTEQEREEIRRRLKRLQEEEQQMLADIDEVRQRMDRSENQSRMAEERKQLEQTREDVQRAAEASSQGSASQALAAGTRAQRQLQELRDQMRKESSNQFSEDLREMRAQARELSQQQEDILKKLDPDKSESDGPKPLTDAPKREELFKQFAQQKDRLTNLVDRATEVSQDAETAEPLLSRELYDSVRKFSQDNLKNMKQTEEELVNRGLMSQNRYDRFKQSSDPDAVKLQEITSELLRQDAPRQASETARRSRDAIEELRRGVEHAATSVLGDDTEALRLAQDQLKKLAEDLEREMNEASTNGVPNGKGSRGGRSQDAKQLAASGNSEGSQPAADAQTGKDSKPGSAREGNKSAEGSQNPTEQQQSNSQQASASAGQQQPGGDQKGGEQKGQSSEGESSQPDGQQAGNSSSSDSRAGQPNSGSQAGAGRAQNARRVGSNRQGGNAAGWGNDWGGEWLDNFNRPTDDRAWLGGPLTGGDFGPWSDRLREVEEVLDYPDLRNQVATARERARLLRQDFKRDLKKPDWAVVRLQIMKPLLEVRDRVADELARRDSQEALVPIDRDPVPTKYSELVRRYYEELGKNKPLSK